MGFKFDDRVLTILTTAPAGLGHIRVMTALKEGLSPKSRFQIMGIDDPQMQWIHRVTSQNRILKQVMEAFQEQRVLEKWFSKNYRRVLRTHTEQTAKRLTDLISVAWPQPEVVVILATHFGLAHEIAAIKPELCRKLGIKLVVAVIVTDDTYQEMWAVNGADVIFVPSNTTREQLLNHLMLIDHQTPEVITVPYPVSLSMGEVLSQAEYHERLAQLAGKKTRLMLPISGAAVQLDYYKDLIGQLTADEIGVTVVSRTSRYTNGFCGWCKTQDGVELVTHRQDADVVAAYEHEYMLSVFAIEVTKPSEQAFKSLYTPKQRGGVVLLFSPPVGRQEKDNLAFLRRHRMIPSIDDQARLNEWCLRGNRLHLTKTLFERAHHWRGILLPEEPLWAGIAVKRLIDCGILAAMGDFHGFVEGHDEIRSDGVKEVWEQLGRLVV